MTTPEELGFVRPTGTDFINTGDNDISTNAEASAAMYDALKLDAANKYSPKNHTHSKIQNTLGEVTLDSAGGVQHHVNGQRVWWVNDQGVLQQGTVPREALDRNPVGIENDLGTVTLDSAGGVQHHVNGQRVWWVNDQGVLAQGTVNKINNSLGTVLLDSAGGVQHQVSGQRVWWVNDQGVLAEGEIPWSRITGAPAAGSGSGFKLVPLALTLGVGGSGLAPTSRHYRLPLTFAAPIARFRVHIRNWNPRLGTIRSGTSTFTGLWLGKHAGNGAFASAPTQLRGGFATPSDGSEWVSAWFAAPDSDLRNHLLSFAYTADESPITIAGASWHSATLSDATAINPAMSSINSTPFDIWIEAETPATTPVVGVLGDSLSVGIGADKVVHDSPISQYARKIGALPYHLAASGDSMDGMMTVNPGKVTRWANLAKPNAILWALGSNDIAGGANLATLQQRFFDLMQVVKGIAPAIYLADIMPRNAWASSSTEETTRRAYNNWLRSLPYETRDIFNFASSISSDDDTISTAYDSGDGTHLNTLGYSKNMEAIKRPMTAVTLSDTGVQDITSLVTAGAISSGAITFQHKNGWNIVSFSNLAINGTGAVVLYGNNHPFLKPWAPGVDGATSGSVTEAVSLGSSGADYRRVTLNHTGGLTAYGVTTGDIINGAMIWPMNRTI